VRQRVPAPWIPAAVQFYLSAVASHVCGHELWGNRSIHRTGRGVWEKDGNGTAGKGRRWGCVVAVVRRRLQFALTSLRWRASRILGARAQTNHHHTPHTTCRDFFKSCQQFTAKVCFVTQGRIHITVIKMCVISK
jgi:hypothetical protein